MTSCIAARAYDNAARSLQGAKAKTNFPSTVTTKFLDDHHLLFHHHLYNHMYNRTRSYQQPKHHIVVLQRPSCSGMSSTLESCICPMPMTADVVCPRRHHPRPAPLLPYDSGCDSSNSVVVDGGDIGDIASSSSRKHFLQFDLNIQPPLNEIEFPAEDDLIYTTLRL
uniref:AP2/ERF domain-containing protein n=1 Tax=Lactuca sativa TaxID=4236 RepID=A0A9R1VHH7_LACSA|nr:hypothetical protein LSAT_V11C500229800 [Lactuca sativa]